MGMFDMSDEDVRKYKEQLHSEAANHVTDEEILAVGAFRRGGAAASMGASYAGLGGIVYAAVALVNKKKSGGMPPRVILVVTPTKIRAFKWTVKGRNYKLQKEVAVWDRAGIKASTQKKTGMTQLTIESPAEGEKITIVGAGVKDDPASLEVMGVIAGEAPVGTESIQR